MTPLSLLKELIAIPSVNPMGRSLEAGIALEGRLSEFLVDLFAKRGFECEQFPVQPGRDNVVARVPGGSGLPTILLDAHQDTVPVEGMTVSPFDPVERSGRVYGRGACDVKGGMAAMICAMDRLAQLDREKRPTVVMACTCDEELDQQGAAHLANVFRGTCDERSAFLPVAPDRVIVAEPTELNVGITHRGVVRWEIQTHGKSVHSSDPCRGENAIYRMARLVTQLEQYAQSLTVADDGSPSACGPKTLSVGVIAGGQSVNIVPARCSIQIDRRTIPDEDVTGVLSDVEAYLRRHLSFDFQMLPPTTLAAPLAADNNRDLADGLLGAVHRVLPSREIVGLPYTTHAPQYAQTGVPTVVFGPGSIKQAHTADEWLSIEQLDQATEILFQFLTQA